MLLKRGWVLQELVLSPRSVYLGAQLIWECQESLARELFPQGKPEEFVASAHMRPLRLSNMLQDRGDYWRWTAHDAWQHVAVSEQCACAEY
jgi:hypothetical protein